MGYHRDVVQSSCLKYVIIVAIEGTWYLIIC